MSESFVEGRLRRYVKACLPLWLLLGLRRIKFFVLRIKCRMHPVTALMIRALFWITRHVFEILAPIPLALLMILSKRRKKSIDIILGPEPMINNIYHKRALERYGYKVKTVVLSTFFITQEFDVDLSRKIPTSFKYYCYIHDYLCLWLFLYAVFSGKCIYMSFRGGMLSKMLQGFILNKLEPFFLKLAGVKTVILPYGADVHDPREIQNLLFRHAMATDYPRFHKTRKGIQYQLNHWTQHADYILSGCDWVEYTYFWHGLALGHFSIDTEQWSPRIKPSKNEIVTILHAPNHRTIKGTQFFIKAVDELKKEGLPVELRIMEKMHNSEVHKAICEADIIADQLVIGWYAMFAIEAMACGKPVLCYLKEEFLDLYEFAGLIEGGEIPVVNCTIKNVKDQIRKLILNRSLIEEIGAKSRKFVEKHHSLDVIGRKFDAINKLIGV